MLLDRLDGDTERQSDVPLLHVFQAKEDKDVAGAFGKLVQDAQHFAQGLIPLKDALWPAILHGLPRLARGLRRNGRASQVRAMAIAQEIRRNREEKAVGALQRAEVART